MYEISIFRPGTIEVIHGLMGSGKTRLIADRINQLLKNNIPHIVLDPHHNTRSKTHITTRFEGKTINLAECIKVNEKNPIEIVELLKNHSPSPKAVIIDELQFFSPEVTSIAKTLAKEFNIHLIATGLAEDYRKEDFGPTKELIKIADITIHLSPLHCAHNSCECKATAMQARFEDSTPVPWLPKEKFHTINWIGDESVGPVWYEAVCDFHHELPGKPSEF